MAGKKVTAPDPIVVLNNIYQVTIDPRYLILPQKISAEDNDLSKKRIKRMDKSLRILFNFGALGNFSCKRHHKR